MKFVFFVSLFLTLAVGALSYKTGRGGALFAAASGSMVIVTILSILSFVSIYVYELPTHHCPFCLLQAGYNSIGYPIYIALFGGGISGLGVGILAPFRRTASLSAVIPTLQRRLTAVALVCFLVLAPSSSIPWPSPA
jgi:hypothetical protein